MAEDTKESVTDATKAAKQSADDAAGQRQNLANQYGGVGSNVQKAVDKSFRDQPYLSLAVAAAIGFVVGAIWKA